MKLNTTAKMRRCYEIWLKFEMRSCVKLCKSCRSRQELSNEYLLLTCKIWRRYSRERASQSLPKINQKLEQKLEKNVELDHRRRLSSIPLRMTQDEPGTPRGPPAVPVSVSVPVSVPVLVPVSVRAYRPVKVITIKAPAHLTTARCLINGKLALTT